MKEHLSNNFFTFENVLTVDECDSLVKTLEFQKIEEKMQERLILSAKEQGAGKFFEFSVPYIKG